MNLHLFNLYLFYQVEIINLIVLTRSFTDTKNRGEKKGFTTKRNLLIAEVTTSERFQLEYSMIDSLLILSYLIISGYDLLDIGHAPLQ